MKIYRFLERLCQRVLRKTRSRSGDVDRAAQKEQAVSCAASKLDLPCCLLVTENRGVESTTPGAAADSAAWSAQLASGAFHDSTLKHTGPAAAELERGGPVVQSTHSLPAASSMEGPTLALAPAAPVLVTVVDSQRKDAELVSTSTQECAIPGTSGSVQDQGLQMRALEPSKDMCMLSATDSGLYSEEEDSDEEYLEVFSEDEEEEEEDDYLVDDGWLIPADEVSLDKVLASNKTETVYNGYWHGNVTVHARCSNTDEAYHSIHADLNTLSNIRHESIQLFLGVCHDLHSDYISIVMDQMKGETLHTLIYKQHHKFSFQSLTKITNQIAQGMEYLHAKGIPHPLLTTHSVTLHYRVCISMLTPGSASMGMLSHDQLPYLPPEVMRTVAQQSSTGQASMSCPSSPHSVRGLQSRCSSTSSRVSYRFPSNAGWSTPTSPNLKQVRRQMENTGYLSPDGPVYSHHKSSSDDLWRGSMNRSGRMQLKADVGIMQTFEANVYSFGTVLYQLLTMERPFSDTPGNVIIYQVSRGLVHHVNTLRDGKFKQSIKKCWRAEPSSRPSFRELLSTFEQNMSPRACGLKSHFSFSEPNQLDKLGCFDSAGLQL